MQKYKKISEVEEVNVVEEVKDVIKEVNRQNVKIINSLFYSISLHYLCRKSYYYDTRTTIYSEYNLLPTDLWCPLHSSRSHHIYDAVGEIPDFRKEKVRNKTICRQPVCQRIADAQRTTYSCDAAIDKKGIGAVDIFNHRDATAQPYRPCHQYRFTCSRLCKAR